MQLQRKEDARAAAAAACGWCVLQQQGLVVSRFVGAHELSYQLLLR
jgi:hypothetical protein